MTGGEEMTGGENMAGGADIGWAARVLQEGGLIAFPTETVYGLGAHALRPEAVEAIFVAKGRPADNPLIVHVGRREDVLRVARDVPGYAHRLMDAFWPGPLSVVLPRGVDVPDVVTAGRDTVAVRMPDHPVALRLLQLAGVPVAAPSANRSGAPSPTTRDAVLEDLGDRIDGALEGGISRIGLESTVVDCTGPVPVVLRHGGLSLEDLRLVVPETRLASTVELASGRSPGTRHAHYRPRARVRIVYLDDPASDNVLLNNVPADDLLVHEVPADGLLAEDLRPTPQEAGRRAWIGLHKPPSGEMGPTEVLPSVDAYARRVFAFFRECDRDGVDEILCQAVPRSGIGMALMDRLDRAAAG